MKPNKKSFFKNDSVLDVMSSLIAIIIGIIVGYIILLLTDSSKATQGILAVLSGGFSDKKSMGQVLYFATPIIMTGLSVGFANKTGLFNIGASGQFTVGAFVAIFIGVKLTAFNNALHWIIALVGAALAGALWGLLPGLLKAKLNVNVVISCIMMNYIGMYLVNFLIEKTIHNPRTNQTMRVLDSANLPKFGLDKIFRIGNNVSSANGGIFIAILFGIITYIILGKTKFGYELKACGNNRDAATYAGINEEFSIVMSMVIAGALSGLGGALLYLAGSGKGMSVLEVIASEGFNGIPVALLGLNHPIGIIISGLFIANLNQGGFNMQIYGFEPQVIEIIVAVIIYFSAFSLLFKGFLSNIGKSDKGNETNAKAKKEEVAK